jgi:hypothetical protein
MDLGYIQLSVMSFTIAMILTKRTLESNSIKKKDAWLSTSIWQLQDLSIEGGSGNQNAHSHLA